MSGGNYLCFNKKNTTLNNDYMTNKEIKLELAKLALANINCTPSIDDLKTIYGWITEEEVDVDMPKTDHDKEPLFEIIKHVQRKGGRCGYGVRIQNIFHTHNINTVGDLLRLGSSDFAKLRDVGRGSLSRVEDAVAELYGITNW